MSQKYLHMSAVLVIYGQTRSNFQIHFYVVAILFLVFDLELILIFPLCVTLYQVSLFGLSIALLFLAILTVGFVLEIGSGAISLSNSDVKNTSNNKLINYNPNKKNFRTQGAKRTNYIQRLKVP